MTKPDNNPSGHFKNYWHYVKTTQRYPIFTYIYRKYWKYNMVRIKLVVTYINFLKLFGYDITRPNRITEKH